MESPQLPSSGMSAQAFLATGSTFVAITAAFVISRLIGSWTHSKRFRIEDC